MWTDAVVEIRLPTDRLLVQSPSTERRCRKASLPQGSPQASAAEPVPPTSRASAPGISFAHRCTLTLNPVLTKVGIRELLQQLTIQSVIVYQRQEAVTLTIPDVPDEGSVPKKRTVLIKEFVAEPIIQALLLASFLFQEFAYLVLETAFHQMSYQAFAGVVRLPEVRPPPLVGRQSHLHQQMRQTHQVPVQASSSPGVARRRPEGSGLNQWGLP